MATVSISFRPGTYYPSDSFSPDCPYPEYPFDYEEDSTVNPVYNLIRNCLREAGLDSEHYGTKQWNPLKNIIMRGSRVFVLPNFVMHRRKCESQDSFQAKCTNGSVIRAIMDYATIASGDPGLVSFGNAPIQGCDYLKIIKDTEAFKVSDFYHHHGNNNVGPLDLRYSVSRWTRFGAMKDRNLGAMDDSVAIDLKTESLLDELYRNMTHPVPVRVGDYSPKETMSYHDIGKHIYLVNRRILESDVIISVPKLKTHQKVGITCALKGTIGAIARKECLAHHRKGDPTSGGDEYPKKALLNKIASHLSDKTSTDDTSISSNIERVLSKMFYHLINRWNNGTMGGSWYGNDTAWRMALDVARILRFARPDGTINKMPVRKHMVILDGVISGEFDGPLRPKPRKSSVVLFSDDICAADAVGALIMGYNPSKIPLIRESFSLKSFPLTEERYEDIRVIMNGRSENINNIPNYFLPKHRPPRGWYGHIEL